MKTDMKEFEKMMKLLCYSEEIAWLGRLLHHKQITDSEYQKIKHEIMRANHVQSDLTAMTGAR